LTKGAEAIEAVRNEFDLTAKERKLQIVDQR
jgi:hypothetical protein